MSLDYSFTKIENYHDLVWVSFTEHEDELDRKSLKSSYGWIEEDDGEEKYMNPVTHSMIWASLITGIGEVTEKNYIEVWFRLCIDDIVNGPRIYERDNNGEREGRSITLEEVKQHIGLSTNVFPKESGTKFYNKKLKSLMRDHGGK